MLVKGARERGSLPLCNVSQPRPRAAIWARPSRRWGSTVNVDNSVPGGDASTTADRDGAIAALSIRWSCMAPRLGCTATTTGGAFGCGRETEGVGTDWIFGDMS